MALRPLVGRIVLIASLTTASAELEAQQTDSTRLLRGATVGVALDRFIADGAEGITAVSLRFTGLNPGRVGADVAIGTYVPALAAGVLLLGLDVGPALNLSAANATWLLKIGGSTIVGVSAEGGGAALFGGYVGAGLVMRLAPRFGARVDLAKRLFVVPGVGSGTIWTLSVGVTSLRS